MVAHRCLYGGVWGRHPFWWGLLSGVRTSRVLNDASLVFVPPGELCHCGWDGVPCSWCLRVFGRSYVMLQLDTGVS